MEKIQSSQEIAEEELEQLDMDAARAEVNKLKSMEVVREVERSQVDSTGKYISLKEVYDWRSAQNAIFGRCCMNPDKFRNTNAYVDPAKFERAVGKSSVTNKTDGDGDDEHTQLQIATVPRNKTDGDDGDEQFHTQLHIATVPRNKNRRRFIVIENVAGFRTHEQWAWVHALLDFAHYQQVWETASDLSEVLPQHRRRYLAVLLMFSGMR